jgi:hypothetical protein
MMYVYIGGDIEAGTEYSVQRLATGWSEFEPRQSQEYSLLHVVQTGSGIHRASYPTCTEGSFPGDTVAGA